VTLTFKFLSLSSLQRVVLGVDWQHFHERFRCNGRFLVLMTKAGIAISSQIY